MPRQSLDPSAPRLAASRERLLFCVLRSEPTNQQLAERDAQKRSDLLKQIQRKIIDDAATIPLVTLYRIGLYWSFLKNWEPSLSTDYYEYYNYQLAWLES